MHDPSVRRFEELIDEGKEEPVDGWDFSWFEGRATEERPSWGYAGVLAERMGAARAALDIQTGGGEVLAGIPQAPPVLAATEAWPPNVALARRALAPLGVTVVEVADTDPLPFPSRSFDLVTSRHPTVTLWDEIGRVLQPGGRYLSQQIGAGTMRQLTDAIMGPQPVSQARSTARAVAAADAAGLDVVDLRSEALRVQFDDIAAVVVFLRKVVWTVPDFTVEEYLEPLRNLHRRIAREGPFVAYSQRFLIEARKRG